jgi:poly(A) polymerase
MPVEHAGRKKSFTAVQNDEIGRRHHYNKQKNPGTIIICLILPFIMKQHLKHPVFQTLSKTAGENNLQVYAIGGFVRDIFLNRPSKDIDIVVIGNGIDFAEKVAQKLKVKVAVFKNFGTAQLKYKDLEIEFVGARKESYRLDSRKPIVENGTLDDDQKRRDFTINALAISLHPDTDGELLDPFGGLADMEQKLIRTPLDPIETFSDDPLRMMRAVRFASQLNFKIDELAVAAIKSNKGRISIVSQERVTDELNKIILSPKPSIGFNYLFDTGLLHIIFPQMTNLYGVEYIDGKGHKDNFYHTLQVLDNICETTADLWLRWAAILHDIAKPATKRFEAGHGWTFHGHEDKGARMVPKIFAQLKLPLNEKMKQVQKLVQLHLRPIVLSQSIVTDSAVRRLLFEAGDEIEGLMLLCKADITTKNEYKVKKYRQNFELVQQKLKDVEERDSIRNWQPPVTGIDIMQLFGIKEGREVGIIKNQIREAILEGEIPNSRPEAIEYTILKGSEIGLKVVATV